MRSVNRGQRPANGVPAPRGHETCEAVLAVAPYPVPIEWAYSRADDGALIPISPGKFAIRSQDLETKFYDTGTFCGFPTRLLESKGAGDDTGFVGYVLARQKAIDIDTEEDWRFAEILFAGTIPGPRTMPFPTFPGRIVAPETALIGTRANASLFRYCKVARLFGRIALPPCNPAG